VQFEVDCGWDRKTLLEVLEGQPIAAVGGVMVSGQSGLGMDGSKEEYVLRF
jgi:hypothetical protein